MLYFAESSMFRDWLGVVLLGSVCGGFFAVCCLAALYVIYKKIVARFARPSHSISTVQFPPLLRSFQRGSARTALLIALSVVALGLLACTSPPVHYSDSHGVWLEYVKRTGF